MTFTRHQLPPEPSSGLPAVRPSITLAATFFAGVWLGWPWFVLNAFALKLDDKVRLAKRLAVGVTGSTALALLAFAIAEPDVAPSLLGLLLDEPEPHEFSILPYIFIALVGWKSAISYLMFEDQRMPAEIHEYYGGSLLNGVPVVVGGALLRSWILLELLPVGWWTLVLA